MTSNNLPVLWVGVGQDVLNQIVSILIAGNVDEWDTWAIISSLANAVEITAEKLNTSNLEAFLNNLRSELVHAVLRGVADDVVDSTSAICWSTMLTDVLNAPVAKLSMSNDVNAGKDLLDAWALMEC